MRDDIDRVDVCRENQQTLGGIGSSDEITHEEQ